MPSYPTAYKPASKPFTGGLSKPANDTGFGQVAKIQKGSKIPPTGQLVKLPKSGIPITKAVSAFQIARLGVAVARGRGNPLITAVNVIGILNDIAKWGNSSGYVAPPTGFNAAWTNAGGPAGSESLKPWTYIAGAGVPNPSGHADNTWQFGGGTAIGTGTTGAATLINVYRGPRPGTNQMNAYQQFYRPGGGASVAGPNWRPLNIPSVVPLENPMANPDAIPIRQPMAPVVPLPMTHPGVFPKPGQMPGVQPGPKPGAFPGTKPGIMPLPIPKPGGLPIVVGPVIGPGAQPWVPPKIVVSPKPGVSSKPPTIYKPPPSGPSQPPKKGWKEKKLNVKSIGGAATAIWVAGNAFTEGVDLMESIYDAIPDYPGKKDNPTPYDMAEAIYDNFDEIDWPSAIENWINNQIEDAVFGGIGKAGNKANQVSGAATGGGHAVGAGGDAAGEYLGPDGALPLPTIDYDESSGQVTLDVPGVGVFVIKS